jgi:hypothetical protein
MALLVLFIFLEYLQCERDDEYSRYIYNCMKKTLTAEEKRAWPTEADAARTATAADVNFMALEFGL